MNKRLTEVLNSLRIGRANRGLWRRQRGAAIAELVVVLPALLMLGLGVLESAFFYQAKTTVTYATFEAARKGATTHAQKRPMLDEFGMRIASIYGGEGSGGKAQGAIAEGQLDAHNPLVTKIDIINPNSEAFLEFGVQNSKTGQVEIPNTHLRYRDPTVIGSESEVNVQDANLLKIQAEYGYQLRVPLVAQAVTSIMRQFDPGNARYYDKGRIPISAVATVRMQSAAWEDGNLLADGTVPGGGSVVNGAAGDPDQRGGDPKSNLDDLDRDGMPNDSDNDIDGDGIPNESDDDDNGDGIPDDSLNGEDDDPFFECETTPPEEDDQGAREEDSSFWGDLWEGVKDGLTYGYEFVRGFFAGVKEQVSDILALILNPIDTAKGLIELGVMFFEDPEGTVKILGDVIGKDLSALAGNCGAYAQGKVIGEYVSPAFSVKLGLRLAKYAGELDLAEVASQTRRILDRKGCPRKASFLAGTLVLTPAVALPIEEIAVKQQVLSRSEHTFVDLPQTVTHTMSRTVSEYHRLITENETFFITEEHPVWVQGDGWSSAREVTRGDVLATQKGDVLVLHNVVHREQAQVFNFSVANTPNYFVGGSGLWVHNAPVVCGLDNSDIVGKGEKLGLRLRSQAPGSRYYDPNADKLGNALGFQAHHLIPSGLVKQYQKLFSAAKEAGYNINNAANGWALPKDADEALALNLPKHSGSHPRDYTDAVREELDNIRDRFDAGEFKNDDAALIDTLYDAQDTIRDKLSNKEIFTSSKDLANPNRKT
ncbi:MAG: AHH domain-containing protein [Pseudomonadota bacterium]